MTANDRIILSRVKIERARKNLSNLEREIGEFGNKGMCPKAIKAIDALKPYKGGNDALWRIHELDNIDKHCALFTYAHDCMLVADWLAEYGSMDPFDLKASNPNFAAVGAFDSEVEKDMEFEINEG